MQTFEKDGITLINGDVREYSPPTFNTYYDLIVTDPPYKLTSGGKSGELGGCLSTDKYDNSGSIVECDISWKSIMLICYSFLRDNSHAYIMSNNRNVQEMLNSAQGVGFYFHNLLVWDKHTAVTNRWYMKDLEFTGFFGKGKAKAINDCGSKMLWSQYQKDATDHPTEKPVELMEHYILNSTKEGDVVFDPFMGSGTTAIACMRTNRRFVGVEKDVKWFNVAKSRVIGYNHNKLM